MGNRTSSQHNYIGRTNSPMFNTGDMAKARGEEVEGRE